MCPDGRIDVYMDRHADNGWIDEDKYSLSHVFSVTVELVVALIDRRTDY